MPSMRRSCTQRLGVLIGGLLALAPCCTAWWPFDSSGDQRAHEVLQEAPRPHFAFGGAPGVVVVENHFGSDPWEDLHRNMQRVVHKSSHPLIIAGRNPQALVRPLEEQLGSILSAFGDHHAGHFGRTGSFQVDDDHQTRFRITAQLPGYKFGAEAGPGSESPLSVRTVGGRSVVVQGMQRSGPMMTSWQRSFSLPKGCDINNVSVTYSSASGNLTVEIPRRNVTEAEAEEQDRGEGELDDPMLPPALRRMQGVVPGIVGHMSAMGPLQPKGGGFLMPMAPGGLPEMLEEVFGMMSQAHPRFQPPTGGEKPVPEDAVVNLVGCFAESQLEKMQLKYYGETNAASFNAMYWHARSDHVPYFAMSRHEQPVGHAFTAHGFAHTGEKPQWGVYDGCGSPCIDEPQRFCGCANEASRGFGNADCPTEGEKRFAVYKIGEAERPDDEEESPPVGQPEVVSHGRPYWQLTENSSEAPAIEIVVPKGTIAKAKGDEVILYNASEAVVEPAAAAQRGAAAQPAAVAQAQAATPTQAPVASQAPAEAPLSSLESSTSGQAAEAATSTTAQSGAAPETPVGKIRLPVGVSPETCVWDESRSADGGQVIKCQLDQRDVKSLPIKVIDEL